MGKKQEKKGFSAPNRGVNRAVTLREESSGKTHVDVSSLLRIQHIQRLATWVSGEAGVSPLGALLGGCLAANAEASGIPLDPSTFLCQRCETILQPGFNCTVRLKKNIKKAARSKISSSCENSVVYTCHFCGHQNLRWGTAKGLVKILVSSRKLSSVDSNGKIPQANIKGNKRVATKDELEHYSGVLVSQEKSFSGFKPKTPGKDVLEEGAVLTAKAEFMSLEPSLLEKTNMVEQGAVTTKVECISGLKDAASENNNNFGEDVIAATNTDSMYELKIISPEKATMKAELTTGSELITPKKNNLEEIGLKNMMTPTWKLASNKEGKDFAAFSDKFPTSANKSRTNDSGKETSGSRKRSRKGWTTLKQIAESNEIERNNKIGNFVIPFFT